MNPEATEAQAPRWLIIENEERRQVFVFPPEQDQTVVVGGGPDAHFRIRDTSPLCFYIEPGEGSLRFVPGYVGHLRLNSHRIVAPVRLPRSAIVEFGRHRLHLMVKVVPPIEGDDPVFRPVAPPSPRSIGTEKCDEAMVTRVATIEATGAVDAPTMSLEAQESAPLTVRDQLEAKGRRPEAEGRFKDLVPPVLLGSSAQLDDDEPALATQIMGSIPDFEESGYLQEPHLRIGPEDVTPVSGRGPAPYVAPKTERSTRDPDKTDPSSGAIGAISDRTEGITFRDFVAPSGKSRAVSLDEPPRKPSRKEDRGSEAVPLPKRASPLAAFRLQLEKLGTWAKEKPGLAIGGGVSAALIIGLTVGGLSKALSDPTPAPAGTSAASVPHEEEIPRPEPIRQETEDAKPKSPDPAIEANGMTAPSVSPDSTDKEEKTAKEREAEEKAAADALAAEEKAHAAEVNRAVQHLIAGRDDEAAHTYQSLAQTKYATEELKRMSEFLERRRNRTQKKPGSGATPDLYR